MAEIESSADAKRVRVVLKSATPGASIAYTTDAGKPVRWKLYHAPLELPAGFTLRSIACRLGFRDSREVTSVVGQTN